MLVGGQSRAGLRAGVPVDGHPRPGVRAGQDAEAEARPHPLSRRRVHRADRRRQDLRHGRGGRARGCGAHRRHPGAAVRRSAHDGRAGHHRRRAARAARRRAGPGDRSGRRRRLHRRHHHLSGRAHREHLGARRRAGRRRLDDRRAGRGRAGHAGSRRPVRRRRRGEPGRRADLRGAGRRRRHGVDHHGRRGRGVHGDARPVPERGHHRRARGRAVGGRPAGGRHRAGLHGGVPDLRRQQRRVALRRGAGALAGPPRPQALLPGRLPAGARARCAASSTRCSAPTTTSRCSSTSSATTGKPVRRWSASNSARPPTSTGCWPGCGPPRFMSRRSSRARRPTATCSDLSRRHDCKAGCRRGVGQPVVVGDDCPEVGRGHRCGQMNCVQGSQLGRQAW